LRAASAGRPAGCGTGSGLRATVARRRPRNWSINNHPRRRAVPHDKLVELRLGFDLHFKRAKSNFHDLVFGVFRGGAVPRLPLGTKDIQAVQ
jgi:hypothetical protein